MASTTGPPCKPASDAGTIGVGPVAAATTAVAHARVSRWRTPYHDGPATASLDSNGVPSSETHSEERLNAVAYGSTRAAGSRPSGAVVETIDGNPKLFAVERALLAAVPSPDGDPVVERGLGPERPLRNGRHQLRVRVDVLTRLA